MIGQYKYWTKYVPAPPDVVAKVNQLKNTYGYSTKRTTTFGEILVSQMYLWHCEAATVRKLEHLYILNLGYFLQLIYTITGWDTRTISTWSGLFMMAFILDLELPTEHKWHLKGGSKEYFN